MIIPTPLATVHCTAPDCPQVVLHTSTNTDDVIIMFDNFIAKLLIKNIDPLKPRPKINPKPRTTLNR